MAVYFKYESAKEYESIPILYQSISVGDLKLGIFESKRYGWGKDFDLIVRNALNNEEYVDERALIAKNTRVLIRRVPGVPCLPILVTNPQRDQPQLEQGSIITDCSQTFDSVDDFGDDVYAIPKLIPSKLVVDDEQVKKKTVVVTPALVPQTSSSSGCSFEWRKPPEGYVCHRCKVPGHFIQHCPTNGDPNYDIKKLKPTTSIPNDAGGSWSCSSKQDSWSDIPPELFCPICKQVMKDAVIASRCCFSSYCDKCIRDHIMCNSCMCICGAKNILADTFLPNLTLRNTIIKYVESSSSSSSVRSEVTSQVQDMVSSHNAQTSSSKTVDVSESRKRAVEEEHQKPGEVGKMMKRKKLDMQYLNNYGLPYGPNIPQGHIFLPQLWFERRQYFEASKVGL